MKDKNKRDILRVLGTNSEGIRVVLVTTKEEQKEKDIEDAIRKRKQSLAILKKARTTKNKHARKYRDKVRRLTNKNVKGLKEFKGRGWDTMHIDHIVPKSKGFELNIPVELMASLENLQMLTKMENMKKGRTITPKAAALLSKWGY